MSNVARLVVTMFGAGLALAALLYLVFQGSDLMQATQQSPQEQRLRLANLAGSCESSVGGDGYGTFRVNRSISVVGEEGEIEVPCRIELGSGGSLTLRDVDLQTNHLVIRNVQANGESHLQVEGSTLTGAGDSGFFARLSDPEDSISVDRSTVDYPLGVWASATGTGVGATDGGRIDVTASTVRSLDPGTDGIQLVAGAVSGVANFVDLRLETVPLDSDVDPSVKRIVLLAGNCRMERVEGDTGICDSQAVSQLQQQ